MATAIATFVKADTATEGNWKGVYGADGWNVFSDTSSNNPTYPAYLAIQPAPPNPYSGTWASSSQSPACLQVAAAGSTNRVAGVWYNTTWSTTVGISGTHQIALYLLDYGNNGFAETVTLSDASSGTILDTRSASGFVGGEYLVWDVSGEVTITFTSTAGHWAVLSGIFYGGSTGSSAPSPSTLTAMAGQASVLLNWNASAGATSYDVYRGTTPGGESTTPIATGITSPTTYTDTSVTVGTTYYYEVVGFNAVGSSGTSKEVSAAPTATTSSAVAQFVTTDTTTEGNWKGVYGADGWNVFSDTSSNNPTYPSNPAYITTRPAPPNPYTGTWDSSSLSPAALQVAATGSTNRVAGVWYNTTWYTTVGVSGTHQVALYLLDINNNGFAETITLSDASSGTVLDTRTASSFANGVYYVWNVSGNVKITFTSTAGHWAVLSGIFYGGSTGSTAPSPVSNLTATAGQASVLLNWNASAGATSYNVYRGTTPGGESTTPIATGITSPTTYTDTSVTAGTTYYYEVVGFNTVGSSGTSKEVSATPTATTSSAVAQFVTTDTTTEGNWKALIYLTN